MCGSGFKGEYKPVRISASVQSKPNSTQGDKVTHSRKTTGPMMPLTAAGAYA